MPFHRHVLDNGLQIVGETSPSARSMALGFIVRTGSRDEEQNVSGVTHFLEHMVFKGTPNRTALEVNRDFDRIGADYNAYTSEENTVFYASILPEYMAEAVDLLTDILQPSLRDDDFTMEKKVIIEEIGMYEDQPAWAAYDQAKQKYFADHPLGNSILGTAKSIETLQRDQMYEYFQRRYVAPNIIVSAAGNFDWDNFIKLIERHCGKWSAAASPRTGQRRSAGAGSFDLVTKADVAQENVIVMSSGPPANSPLRHAADTLAMIVGDDSGSRLYWQLVDPGRADSADMSFHEFDDVGVFFTSFSCEPDTTDENLAITVDVLKRVQSDGVTAEELAQAKNKILSRVVRSSERPMGRMRAVGMAWNYLGEYRSVDDELRDFDAVTLDDVRKVLDEYPLDKATTFALGPLPTLKNPLAG